ncbi:MAG: hypothetical protein HZA22_06985 [Nitrospirae bacterium]|nr:hypothetical protein [Nitrospirota bacterium]
MQKRDWANLLSPDYPASRKYPVYSQNFLAAAHRAGIIRKVYWVPPSKKPVGDEDFDSFKGYLMDIGVAEAEVEALKRTDYSIEGRLNGVQFYICSIKDLPNIPGGAALLVDLSFFSETYENEVKTPFLDRFGGTVEILGRRVPKVASAVISNSTMLGTVPLDMRFAGGYVKAWLTSPDRLVSGPLRQWELRSQAMYHDTFYQMDDALDSYLEAVKLAPDDASLRFDLARALNRMKALDPLKNEIDMAVSLDPGYYPQYFVFARALLDNEVPWAAEVCVKDAIKVNPMDPRSYDVLYEVYESEKMYDKVAEAVEKVIGLGFDGAFNYGKLGGAYTRAGMYQKAREAYEKAVSLTPVDDRKSLAGFLDGLADAYAGDKRVLLALDTYKLAADKADDPHAKMIITQKAEALRELWAPFMGGEQAPAPQAPAAGQSPPEPPR